MSVLPKNNDMTSLTRRLDAIISILCNPTKIQEADLKDKIALLSNLGFENNEIASILNTTYSLVAKEKSLLKKVKKNG